MLSWRNRIISVNSLQTQAVGTVKFLNFRMPENLAVIYLKFKQKAQTLGYLVKKMPMV